MLDILRDPVWEFVGGVVITIVIGVIAWWTQRRRKALSFDIISRTPLLSAEDEVKGKLQVLFYGEPVQDVHLATVMIINSGNVPIISADYERPVNLSFGEEAQILTAEVTETNPDSLQVSVDIEATRIVLRPVLLNGGDSITLKLLINRLGGISVDGRIVGVKDIRELGPEAGARIVSFSSFLSVGGLGCAVAGILLALFARLLHFPHVDTAAARIGWLGIVAMFTGFIGLCIGDFLQSGVVRRLRRW